MLRFRMLAAVIAVLCFAAAWAQGTKPFTLQAGKSGTFTTVIYAAGTLKVTLETRAACKVVVMDHLKRVLLENAKVTGPNAEILVPVTNALVGHRVVIRLLPLDTKVAAAGKIAVTGPPIVPPKARITAKQTPQTVAKAKALLVKMQTKILEQIRKDEQARQTLLAQQASTVRAKLTSLATARTAAALRQYGQITNPGMVAGTTQGNNETPASVPTPTLTRASRTEAAPNDWITLTGTNFSASCGVRCEVGANNVVNSPEVRFRGVTEISFRVPDFTIAQSTATGRVSVYAPAPGNRTLTSTALTFTFKQAVPTLATAMNADSKAEGEPGTTLLITGTGFTGNTEIHCQIDATRDLVAMPMTGSTATEIITVIPNFEGIASATDGFIYLKYGANQTARRPFTYKPQIVTLYANGRVNSVDLLALPGTHNLTAIATSDTVYGGMPDGSAGGMCVFHDIPNSSPDDLSLEDIVTELLGTVTYDDVLFDGGALINNWILDGITLTKEHDEDIISIKESHPGTSNLRIVTGWDSWNGSRGGETRPFLYGINFILKGPKGTAYKN